MTAFRGGDVIQDKDGTTWLVYQHEWLVISEDAANMLGGRFTLIGRAEPVVNPPPCDHGTFMAVCVKCGYRPSGLVLPDNMPIEPKP